MRLRFTPRAVHDISEIADYLQVHSPAAAKRVRSAIYGSLRNLLIFPRAGRRQKTHDVRKLVTPRYRYLIYYTVDAETDEIVIHGVRHPAGRREHRDA
jgi:toxin ParE1/3/4